jgi:fatty acid amide hydrolase 2
MLPLVAATIERSARDLAAAIRARELSAREVVEAHAWRLHRCQPRTNALACDRFAAALADAEAADERIAAAGPDDALPPFLGVPCTVKESIALRGMPNCAGMVTLRDRRSETTAPAAQRLIDAGFIPLGVTNTSELTMWIESVNRVYGRTRNAYDPRRTAGGSSGGEGAAVGSGGSPVGLGSDIAGSIRIPAFFNGVFGHKPSPGLVPNTGQFPNTHGEAAFMLTLGPLARHAGDLMPVTRIVSGPDGEDPRCVARELGDPEAVDLASVRVLVADDASLVPARRELREARDAAAQALREAGAHCETVSLKQLRRALELFMAALGDGAGVTLNQLLEQAGAQPHGPRPWLAALRGRGDHTAAILITLAVERAHARVPPGRTRRALAAVGALRAEVAGILGPDGILLHQPHPRVAPKHGATVGRAWVITPAAVFNLLGLPVTQVPLGLNRRGLPLGVQVASADGHDHLTIAAALELERRFGGWVRPVGG